jgi:hypothetical protein
MQFGYLSHESIMRTIELLGSKVIPELSKEGVVATVRPASGAEAQESEALSRLVD